MLEDDEESALVASAEFQEFEQRIKDEADIEDPEDNCLLAAYKRYKEVEERYSSKEIGAYAGVLKFFLCNTEKENCGEDKQFGCGFTNGLLQELDWLTLVDAVSEFEITKEDIKEVLLCLTNDIPIGTHPSNPTFEDAVFKCFTGVSLTGLKDGINDFVKENWTEPYYQGQATVFALTLISPFKAGIVKKLNKLTKYSSKIPKFESLAKAKNADELVGIAKSLTKGAKTNLLNKLASLDDAKAFVNSLDDVADAGLLNKIDNLSQTQLDNLNAFYKNRQSPAGFSKTDYNFTATKTITGQSQPVSISYKHGFPEFHNSSYCPTMTFADGSAGKFKYVNNSLKADDYTKHFGWANEELAKKFGKGTSSWPAKNAEGFHQVGNYRWNGTSTQFELRNANGAWEKYTWHHFEDGKTMIPVLSDVHSPGAGAGGFTHSGGNKILEGDFKGVFEFTAF